MEGLHHCGSLRELWLHDNRISVVAGMQSLVHLQVMLQIYLVGVDMFVGGGGDGSDRGVVLLALLLLLSTWS